MKTNKYEIDMCNGSIMDKLISFALPLMLSGILQLMFNAVDIIVVGHFTGKQALAAVGSTTALINVFTNLFIGISLGANVLAARFFCVRQGKRNVRHGTYRHSAGTDQRNSHGWNRGNQCKRCAASYGNAGQCHCTVNPLHADLFSGNAVFYAL